MGLLDERVAVVTGAGRGIGRAIALCLADEGARVVVNDIGVSLGGDGTDEDPAEQVVQEIVGRGGAAVANRDRVDDFDGRRPDHRPPPSTPSGRSTSWSTTPASSGTARW